MPTIDFTGAINLAGSGAGDHRSSRPRGGGTITANNAANQITGFTGTGVNLNGVTIGAAGVTFNTVSSAAAGAANGILLTNVAGPGAFTVNGGAITATTRALDIDDNSGNVTIGATLTTSGAAARSVEVTNRDGGTVDINGLVTDNSLGINLSTNGTGLVRFDGGIIASTGANTAFNATVQRQPRRHRHQRRDRTEQHADDDDRHRAQRRQHDDPRRRPDVPEHLRRHRASGRPTASCSTTRACSGGLHVTRGRRRLPTTAPVGTIQNTTSHGISLTSTFDVGLGYMNILSNDDAGIKGISVNNFRLNRSNVNNNGNSTVRRGHPVR